MMEGVKQGDPDAQFFLGFMLEKGIGFSKDEAEAVKWYRKAVEQENFRAKRGALSMLGLMYADGRGVTKDNTNLRGQTPTHLRGQTPLFLFVSFTATPFCASRDS